MMSATSKDKEMATLSYTDPTGNRREHRLGAFTRIGRHPEQDFQVLDRVVSKEHSHIRQLENGDFVISDNNSRNGTFLNGTAVEGRQALQDGDRIMIGSTELIFFKPQKTSPAGMVTMHSDEMTAQIQRALSQNEDRFIPADEIKDEHTLRRDYEKLRISYELSQAIGLEMDRDALLNKILDKAFEIFPADRGVILLRTEGEKLLPMAVKTRGEEDTENVRISETIIREILEEKKAILSSDAMMDSRFQGAHSIILQNIRSTMTVPLLHEDAVLGVIHLDSKIARGAFKEKDLQILQGFAAQAAVFIQHQGLLTKFEGEILMRDKMQRLLSPNLVEEVVSGRLDIKKGGESRYVTSMFADIRGFTSISEQITPQELVALLNEYFELMVDVIFKYEGTLDKFVGDEIMALWGAPISKEDDTERAVLAALEMQELLGVFNAKQLKKNAHQLHIGIGLNTGEVVAGYIGSTKSMSYTVMGDNVNTAARLCSAANAGEVLIGANTFSKVGAKFNLEKLPPTKLKNKSQHVDIYRVLSAKTNVDRVDSTSENPKSNGEL